jgi:hypothetical protein
MRDWSKVGKAIAILCLAIILLLLAWLFAGSLLPWVIVRRTFAYAVDQITRVSGWDVNLVKGLVALALIPFGVAVADVTRVRSRNRRRAQFVLALYLAAFYLVMWRAGADSYFSATGQPTKCYAITPDGIRVFDDCEGRTVDPQFGIAVHPVTPDIAESIERERRGIRPRLIPLARASNLVFFDGATGRPLVWYYRWPDGHYDLFSSPGFHPQLNEPLKPVTREIVLQIEGELSAEQKEFKGQLPVPALVPQTASAVAAQSPGAPSAPGPSASGGFGSPSQPSSPVNSTTPNSPATRPPGKDFKDNEGWRRFQRSPPRAATQPQL